MTNNFPVRRAIEVCAYNGSTALAYRGSPGETPRRLFPNDYGVMSFPDYLYGEQATWNAYLNGAGYTSIEVFGDPYGGAWQVQHNASFDTVGGTVRQGTYANQQFTREQVAHAIHAARESNS